MLEQGLLQEIKLYVPEAPQVSLSRNFSQTNVGHEATPKPLEKGHSLVNMEKLHKSEQNSQAGLTKQSLIHKIE